MANEVLKRIYALEPDMVSEEPHPECEWQLSPSWGQREYGPLDTIVIHTPPNVAALDWVNHFRSAKEKSSAHLVIPRFDGQDIPVPVALVSETAKAWHIPRGVTFQGADDVNSRSLGLYICAQKDSSFNDEQIITAARWCRYWIQKYPIRYIVSAGWLLPSEPYQSGSDFPWDNFIKAVERGISVDRHRPSLEIDGKPVKLDLNVLDGRLYGEIEPVVTALGYEMDWHGPTRTIRITPCLKPTESEPTKAPSS